MYFFNIINNMSKYAHNKLNSSNIIAKCSNAEFTTTTISGNQVAVITLRLIEVEQVIKILSLME